MDLDTVKAHGFDLGQGCLSSRALAPGAFASSCLGGEPRALRDSPEAGGWRSPWVWTDCREELR